MTAAASRPAEVTTNATSTRARRKFDRFISGVFQNVDSEKEPNAPRCVAATRTSIAVRRARCNDWR
jgi:hypothetical protein